HAVNNGVYKTGFAGSQAAYEKEYTALWAALDELEERLSTRRYLMGPSITEADVRLFPTLIRFDPVYYGHFKANRQPAVHHAQSVELHQGPVPDPRLRRHDRLRADQGALLLGAHGHQPHPGGSA